MTHFSFESFLSGVFAMFSTEAHAKRRVISDIHQQTELQEKREPKPSLSPQGFHPLPGAPRSKTYSSPVPAPQPVCCQRRSAGSHFLGDEHRDVHTGSNWHSWGIFGWKSLSRMAFSTQLISQCLPVLSSSFYCKVPWSPLSCCKLL